VHEPDSLCDLFHGRGLKITPQRQSIFRSLYRSTGHPTAESIYAEVRAEMPTLSLKTVYETLHILVALRQIYQLDLGPGSTRFDPIGRPHDHLLCSSCGRIEDLHGYLVTIPLLPLSQRHGFHIEHAEVVLHGMCPDCAPIVIQTSWPADEQEPESAP
jgi:Fe2+ or Zn2+ uptake regulation protein